jgi:hypothetical protein
MMRRLTLFQSQPVITATSTVLNDEYPTVGNDVMKEWKTYRDEKLGVEVQYPAGLKVIHSAVERSIVSPAGKFFATTSIAVLSFEPRGYDDTNLREATINGEYKKISQSECLKTYNDLKKNAVNVKEMEKILGEPVVSSRLVDGITWYKANQLEATAGNRYRGIVYFVYHNAGCYTAALTLHSINSDMVDNNSLKEYDPAFYIDTFEKMIARVKFINK